jgi:hypothetical protein
MKTYTVNTYYNGEPLALEINIPTPKQLQAAVTYERFNCRILISNFSRQGKESYTVARLERETNETLIRLGFEWKSKAAPNMIEDCTNRQDAISMAEAMILNRY